MIRHVSLSFSLNPADSNHVQPQVSPLGWWLPSGGLSSSFNLRLTMSAAVFSLHHHQPLVEEDSCRHGRRRRDHTKDLTDRLVISAAVISSPTFGWSKNRGATLIFDQRSDTNRRLQPPLLDGVDSKVSNLTIGNHSFVSSTPIKDWRRKKDYTLEKWRQAVSVQPTVGRKSSDLTVNG